MDWALVGDLRDLLRHRRPGIRLEGDPALELIDLAVASFSAVDTVFSMNLGVPHLDRERRKLPALALGIELKRIEVQAPSPAATKS
jgi:hypothetical protein